VDTNYSRTEHWLDYPKVLQRLRNLTPLLVLNLISFQPGHGIDRCHRAWALELVTQFLIHCQSLLTETEMIAAEADDKVVEAVVFQAQVVLEVHAEVYIQAEWGTTRHAQCGQPHDHEGGPKTADIGRMIVLRSAEAWAIQDNVTHATIKAAVKEAGFERVCILLRLRWYHTHHVNNFALVDKGIDDGNDELSQIHSNTGYTCEPCIGCLEITRGGARLRALKALKGAGPRAGVKAV